MRPCACDTASRLCVRTVVCRSAFSLAPSLRSTGSAAPNAALFACFFTTLDESDLSIAFIVGHGPGLPNDAPTTDAAMEISRFPCRRRVRMPGSSTTRGWLTSRESDVRHVAFCWTGEHRHPELVLR